MIKNKMMDKRYSNLIDFIVFFVIMFILAVFAYRQYLFGNKLFVITAHDDSIGQIYPIYLNWARRISNGEIGQFFDFSNGLGQNDSSIVFSLSNWFCFFGEKNVAYLLGVNQTLRVFLAGIFAYIFAKLKNANSVTSAIIGMGYAFCIHIIVRQEFFSYAIETVVVMLWLLSYEYSYIKNRVVLVPIVTWMVFYYFDGLNAILWGCTFAAYILFDSIINDRVKFSLKKVIYYEGVFITTFLILYGKTLYYYVKNATESSRFVEATAVNVDMPLSATTDAISNATVSNLLFIDRIKDFLANNIEKPYGVLAFFMRTIGMSINGTGVNYFGGTGSFLVDGGFYCGIAVMLIVPYALCRMNIKKRVVYLLAYLATGVYVMVLPFRYLANGYACPGFRFSALRILLLFVLTAIEGFNIFFNDNETKNKKEKIVIITTWLVVTLIMLYAFAKKKVILPEYWIISEVLITLYTVVFVLYKDRLFNKNWLCALLVLFASVEAISVSWDYINNQYTLKKDGNPDMIVQGANEAGYDDGTIEAIQYLREVDNDWYRVDKDYNSVFLMDPMAQDYNGTTTYIGGLGIGDDFVDMCNKFALNIQGSGLLYGPMGNVYTQSLLGVKYVLTRNKEFNTYGMSHVDTVGDIAIYRNDLAMPVAYVCGLGVYADRLQELSDIDRQRMLLKACVLDESLAEFGYYEGETVKAIDLSRECTYNDLEKMAETDVAILGLNPVASDTVISYCENNNEEITRKGVVARNGNQVYIENLGSCKPQSLYLSWPYSEISKDELTYNYYIADAEVYYKDVVNDVKERQKNGLNVLEYDDYHIKGTVKSSTDGMLVTSIPYNSPFSIYIDGERVKKEKVNLYFMGTEITKGEHEIEFSYGADNRILSIYKNIIYTIIKVCILGFMFEVINTILVRKGLIKGKNNE